MLSLILLYSEKKISSRLDGKKEQMLQGEEGMSLHNKSIFVGDSKLLFNRGYPPHSSP